MKTLTLQLCQENPNVVRLSGPMKEHNKNTEEPSIFSVSQLFDPIYIFLIFVSPYF